MVVQPYEFGYQAIKMMNQYLGGDKAVVPATKQVFVPTLVIKQADVDAFTTKINQLRGRS